MRYQRLVADAAPTRRCAHVLVQHPFSWKWLSPGCRLSQTASRLLAAPLRRSLSLHFSARCCLSCGRGYEAIVWADFEGDNSDDTR